MIRLATKDDAQMLLEVFAANPAVGTLCEMHWRLLTGNEHMPHKFFILSGGAVLKLSGRRAVLCGAPMCEEEADELEIFLNFNHVGILTSLGWRPPSWNVPQNTHVLVREPSLANNAFCRSDRPRSSEIGDANNSRTTEGGRPYKAIQTETLPEDFDSCPPVNDVMAILKADGGELCEEAISESFWVDFHIRRNHSVCAVYGIWRAGRLVSTAGIWALTPTAGYIANVETLQKYRGHGYASALIQQLCVNYSRLTLSLMCEDNLVPFYAKHGFNAIETQGFVSYSK